jgi:uncharacterized OB-fold protein
MAEFIEFTSNYHDKSTKQGFQWEFFCQRCNNGYRSKFQASPTGLLTDALDAASSFFGGIMGNIADMGNRVHSATWEQAHDSAFLEAVEEVREFFVQCPNCNEWVCRKRCWNESRGLCLDCAPSANVAASQAQAEAMAQQARDEVSQRKYDVSEFTKGDKRRGGCPNCGAALAPNAKFCAECGTPIKATKFCSNCGAELDRNAKFCPECGTKQ